MTTEAYDPILDAVVNEAGDLINAEGEATYPEPRLGSFPEATLQEVVQQGRTDERFGFRLGLNIVLKEGDNFPYKGRLDLPSTPVGNGKDPEAWQLKRQADRLAILNRVWQTFGGKGVFTRNIDSDEDYAKLVAAFKALEGNKGGVKVSADGKNVKTEVDGKEKWTFEPNGFTKMDGLRPRKKR